MPKTAPILAVSPEFKDGQVRAVIDAVLPAVDGGRFAIKRVAGEPVHIVAHCITDGHDALRVMLRWRSEADPDDVREVPMTLLYNDIWEADFTPPSIGRFYYTVTAWVDSFASWHHELTRRVDADDIRIAAQVGAIELDGAASRAAGEDREILSKWARDLQTAATRPDTDPVALKALALDP